MAAVRVGRALPLRCAAAIPPQLGLLLGANMTLAPDPAATVDEAVSIEETTPAQENDVLRYAGLALVLAAYCLSGLGSFISHRFGGECLPCRSFRHARRAIPRIGLTPGLDQQSRPNTARSLVWGTGQRAC
jgi:hypothetical protein